MNTVCCPSCHLHCILWHAVKDSWNKAYPAGVTAVEQVCWSAFEVFNASVTACTVLRSSTIGFKEAELHSSGMCISYSEQHPLTSHSTVPGVSHWQLCSCIQMTDRSGNDQVPIVVRAESCRSSMQTQDWDFLWTVVEDVLTWGCNSGT